MGLPRPLQLRRFTIGGESAYYANLLYDDRLGHGTFDSDGRRTPVVEASDLALHRLGDAPHYRQQYFVLRELYRKRQVNQGNET